MEFNYTYQILRKGGNISGYFYSFSSIFLLKRRYFLHFRYTALVGLIPDLKLGYTFLMNGEGNEFYVSDLFIGNILASFVQVCWVFTKEINE